MPRPRKRHTLLGCKFSASPKKWAECYAREFVGVGNYPLSGVLQYYREEDIWNSINAVALHHFGYALTKPPEEFLERGFDVVVHYFCDTDWWKGDKDATRALDKSRRSRSDLYWFNPFSNGLLLGLLSERWKDLARVCSWVEAGLPHDYTGHFVEAEVGYVYRSIAASLRPEPMPGLAKLEKKIRKCRKLEAKLLFQAWEAAREKNQAAFEESFIKSLRHFEANFIPTSEYFAPIHWIAPHHSVVGLAARRLGMKLPELTPKQDCWIITRESLGLPPKQK